MKNPGSWWAFMQPVFDGGVTAAYWYGELAPQPK